MAKTSVGVEKTSYLALCFHPSAETLSSIFLLKTFFLCFSAGSLLMLGREKKIKGSLIGRRQHLDGGVVSTLCVLEQSEKELKDGIESKIILRKHCLKTKGTFK